MIRLPWSVVAALKLVPVGQIDPSIFGLRHVPHDSRWARWWHKLTMAPRYAAVDRERLKQTRNLLGPLLYAPTNGRPMSRHPWVTTLEQFHRGVTE